MGVQKRADGAWEVYIYVPKKLRKPGEGAKRYIRPRHAKRGDAVQAFEDAKRALKGKPAVEAMQVHEYAARWLEFKHGPGTRRPSRTTLNLNRLHINAFLKDYGDHTLDGIPRHEALDWSRIHQAAAKAVSAMFNDAVNDGLIQANPFANRQQKQSRGRKDIEPLTEQEVERLGEIALEHWGVYGKTVRAWILFSAWVGTRPGETFGVDWADLDFKEGLVTVPRCKPPYNTDVIVFPKRAQEAVLELGSAPVAGRASETHAAVDAPPSRAAPTRAPEGLVFRTVQGRRFTEGSHSRYWDPVRLLFEKEVGRERARALRDDQPTLALYTLRHACASMIVANGGNEYDVALQLGHTPEVARETYIHTYVEDRQARLRQFLDGGQVSSLDAARKKRGA